VSAPERASYDDFVYEATTILCRCGKATLYRIGGTKCLACFKCGRNAMLVPAS
jgi:hypothetical protein